MEKSFHKMSLCGAVQNFKQSSPLTIIDKNRMSVLIPSSFKIYSPILAEICGSFPFTDDVTIITPDCSGSVILSLCELVSSGITNNAAMDHYEEIAKENINQYPESIEEIINTGTLFGLNIDHEAVSLNVKTDKREYSELSAPSELQGLKIENVLRYDSIDGQDVQRDIELFNNQSFDSSGHHLSQKCNGLNNSNFSVKVASFAKWPSDAQNVTTCENDQDTCDKDFKDDEGYFSIHKGKTACYRCRYCDFQARSKSKKRKHQRKEHVTRKHERKELSKVLNACPECNRGMIQKTNTPFFFL